MFLHQLWNGLIRATDLPIHPDIMAELLQGLGERFRPVPIGRCVRDKNGFAFSGIMLLVTGPQLPCSHSKLIEVSVNVVQLDQIPFLQKRKGRGARHKQVRNQSRRAPFCACSSRTGMPAIDSISAAVRPCKTATIGIRRPHSAPSSAQKYGRSSHPEFDAFHLRTTPARFPAGVALLSPAGADACNACKLALDTYFSLI